MKPHPLFVKAVAIGAIAVLLSLALSRIGALVDERQNRFAEAEQSVEQSQAGRQALLGPLLRTHCTESWDVMYGRGATARSGVETREFIVTSVPARLDVTATATMEPRWRGLFKVNTYGLHAEMEAAWAPVRPPLRHANGRLQCEPPVLQVEVSDPRGIRRADVRIGSDLLVVQPGTGDEKRPQGFQARLPDGWLRADVPLPVKLSLDLTGTSEFGLVPVGRENHVTLSGDWPHPSFGGRFLPTRREVRKNGFDATWEVSALATGAATDLSGEAVVSTAVPLTAAAVVAGSPDEVRGARPPEAFGVAFIDPVNPYTLSDRAIKYGLLFIGLTFVAVAMVELLLRRRVHPVQYLLVGCAISLFFLLLLSLSEHFPFAVSYGAAAAACVALLAYYGRHVLGGWREGLAFGAGIAGLYGALYTLLQMEQTALVIGSLLLFAVLAAVMVATRRFDWYGVTAPR
jgi:inner membrane protein